MGKNSSLQEKENMNLSEIIKEKEIDKGKKNFILTYLKEKKNSVLLLTLSTAILIALVLSIYSLVGYTK